MTTKSTPLNEAVGHRVRELRLIVGANARRLRVEVVGATQADVARELVRLGVQWSPARVAQLEAGGSAPTLPILLLVAAALDRLMPVGGAVTLTDLLVGADGIQLAPGVVVPTSVITEVVHGEPARALFGFHVPTAGADTAAVMEAQASYTRTDERAAAELGLSRADMVIGAVGLWGHSLSVERDLRATAGGITSRVGKARLTTELREELAVQLVWGAEETITRERDRRSGPSATPQKRGRVTRELIAEVRAELNSAGDPQ